jgi:hypothetical protein
MMESTTIVFADLMMMEEAAQNPSPLRYGVCIDLILKHFQKLELERPCSLWRMLVKDYVHLGTSLLDHLSQGVICVLVVSLIEGGCQAFH